MLKLYYYRSDYRALYRNWMLSLWYFECVLLLFERWSRSIHNSQCCLLPSRCNWFDLIRIDYVVPFTQLQFLFSKQMTYEKHFLMINKLWLIVLNNIQKLHCFVTPFGQMKIHAIGFFLVLRLKTNSITNYYYYLFDFQTDRIISLKLCCFFSICVWWFRFFTQITLHKL